MKQIENISSCALLFLFNSRPAVSGSDLESQGCFNGFELDSKSISKVFGTELKDFKNERFTLLCGSSAKAMSSLKSLQNLVKTIENNLFFTPPEASGLKGERAWLISNISTLNLVKPTS
ncbi:MAG: hypothetical protein JKY54_14480 [Flavobacteriales bacterium]|nr:hypothetical protein [Flavobacteriales bacterium]